MSAKSGKRVIEISDATARNFGPRWYARLLAGEMYDGGDRIIRLRDVEITATPSPPQQAALF